MTTPPIFMTTPPIFVTTPPIFVMTPPIFVTTPPIFMTTPLFYVMIPPRLVLKLEEVGLMGQAGVEGLVEGMVERIHEDNVQSKMGRVQVVYLM